MQDEDDDLSREEVIEEIQRLTPFQRAELVALMWLGRGDGDLASWRELHAQAAQAHNQRTASYLIGTSMLADYLEEAMSQFGKSFEEFEAPI